MRFDNQIIKPTQRYLDALHELAEAELEMLDDQLDTDCWQYMELFVGDLGNMWHIQFKAEGLADKPDYMGESRVMVHASLKGASSEEMPGPGGES